MALQPLQLTQPIAFKIPVDRPNLQAQAISGEFNLLITTLNQMQTKINELKATNVLFERNRTRMMRI